MLAPGVLATPSGETDLAETSLVYHLARRMASQASLFDHPALTPQPGYAAGLDFSVVAALRAAISACNARFRARRAIFCLRSRWNRAVSPQVFDMTFSFL